MCIRPFPVNQRGEACTHKENSQQADYPAQREAYAKHNTFSSPVDIQANEHADNRTDETAENHQHKIPKQPAALLFQYEAECDDEEYSDIEKGAI
jgi:hypothetical protein